MAKHGRRRYLEDGLALAEQSRSDHKGYRHYSCLAHYFHSILTPEALPNFCDPGRRRLPNSRLPSRTARARNWNFAARRFPRPRRHAVRAPWQALDQAAIRRVRDLKVRTAAGSFFDAHILAYMIR